MKNSIKKSLKIFLGLMTVALCVPMATAGINRTVHMPKDGDCYDRRQCETLSPGLRGDSAVWDFSEAVMADRISSVKYHVFGDSLLVRSGSESFDVFHLKGDSVFLKSHENRLCILKDTVATLHLRFPMQYGDSISSPLDMVGNYCGNNALMISGTRTVKIDGRGTLILPDDTIPDVLRMHVRTVAKMKVSKDTQLPHLNCDSDSLMSSAEDIYLWYSDSYRFPLAEIRQKKTEAGSAKSETRSASFICPPDVQEYSLGISFVKNTNSANGQNGSSESGEGEGSVISDLTLTSGTGFVDLSFTSGVDADVMLVLTDVFGRVYSSLPRRHAEAGVVYSERINVSRLPSGDYVLHVTVGTETQNRKFTIK